MAHDAHQYSTTLTWTGNRGDGTARYEEYGRGFTVSVDGKGSMQGSADPAFRGDASLLNPEDLLLVSISSCHMLSYLALCARHRINVLAYDDDATAVMELSADGGGRFTSATLHPRVVVRDPAHVDKAIALHERAHALCFIANSCNFPIAHEATVTVIDPAGAEQAR